MKQIKFRDKDDHYGDTSIVHGGILTDDGDIICGCCGGVIPSDEARESCEIIETYETWLDLDEAIIGN